MTDSAWKKLEKSDFFRRLKLRLRQLTGKEPRFKLDVKLKTVDYSGWVIAPELINANDIVYSLGVCDEIQFDLSIIEKKQVQVFAFDPTPYSVDWISKQHLPSEFHFNPWAAAASDGSFYLYPRMKQKGEKSKVMYTFLEQEENDQNGICVEAFTIESMAKKLNHEKVDILKMDIEGAEYDVIDNILAGKLRPKIILIEFHHRFKNIGKEKTIQAVTSLRQAGYLVMSVSATGREIGFVRKSALI